MHTHIHNLKNNKHCNYKLQRSFNKYGIDSFEFYILELIHNDKLIEREQYYINLMKPIFNICKIAGNTLGYKHTEEMKKEFSINRKGNKNSLGRKLSDKTKKKISDKAKLRGLHPAFMEASKKANTGRKHTIEQIEKTSLKQIKLTPEQVKEVRYLLSKGIYQYELAEQFNVSQRVITKINLNIGIYANL